MCRSFHKDAYNISTFQQHLGICGHPPPIQKPAEPSDRQRPEATGRRSDKQPEVTIPDKQLFTDVLAVDSGKEFKILPKLGMESHVQV